MVTEKNSENNVNSTDKVERMTKATSGSRSSTVLTVQPDDQLDASVDSTTKTEATSDSDFDENDVSGAEDDDDSIPADEDAADEEEVSSLMKESQMSLDELLASYGISTSASTTNSNNDHSNSNNRPNASNRSTRLRTHRQIISTSSSSSSSSNHDSVDCVPPAKKPRRMHNSSNLPDNITATTTTNIVNTNTGPVSNGDISALSVSIPHQLRSSGTDQRVPFNKSSSDITLSSNNNQSKESYISNGQYLTCHPRSVPCSHTASPIPLDCPHSCPNSSAPTPKSSINSCHNGVGSNTKQNAETNYTDDISKRDINKPDSDSDAQDDAGNGEDQEYDRSQETSDIDDKKHQSNEDFSSRFWKHAITGEHSPPSYNSDDDEDYAPSVESGRDWKGEIRVGEEYQANVPPPMTSPVTVDDYLLLVGTAERLDKESVLLWKPCLLPESKVIQYERSYAQTVSSAIPHDGTIDDEEALFLLLQCDHDPDEALQRLQLKAVPPSEIPGYLDSWSESDCTAFEKGFALNYKNFRQIRETRLRHKTVGELIHFYYLWKKTARHDEFAQFYRWRRGDKKKSAHPNVTDFMDCLAMEQDVLAESYMQNVNDINQSHSDDVQYSNKSVNAPISNTNNSTTPNANCRSSRIDSDANTTHIPISDNSDCISAGHRSINTIDRCSDNLSNRINQKDSDDNLSMPKLHPIETNSMDLSSEINRSRINRLNLPVSICSNLNVSTSNIISSVVVATTSSGNKSDHIQINPMRITRTSSSSSSSSITTAPTTTSLTV